MGGGAVSGPWEDFAPTATVASAGPWQDFKAGGSGSGGPWEDFKSNAQSLGKTPEAPYVDQLLQGFQRGKQFVAPLANIPDMVASKAHDLLGLPPVTPEGAAGVLSAMKHNLDIAGGGDVDKLYTQMTGHQPNPYLRYAPPVFSPEASQAAKHFVGRGISEFATPENALLAAATGGMEPAAMKILGLLFGVPQLKQAYEEARQGDVEGALLHGGVGAVATVAGARSEPKAPPLLAPGENLHVSGRLEPTYREGEIPTVGMRPVDIQQQVVVPPGFDIGSPKPVGLGGSQLTYGKMGGKVERQPGQRYSGVEIPSDFNRYKELTDLARSAIARGQMPEQNVLAEIEAIKNRQPIRGMPPVEPTQKQATKADLKPAVEVNGKLLVGNVGDTHADILTRNGINPDLYPHESSARGFTTDGQTLINRQQAAKIAGEAGTAKAGGLDSQDLQPGGNVNAIRELRTDELSKTQSSGDLQKVGEEVREGAGAQAQGETPRQDAQRETQGGVQGVEGTFFSGMPLRLAKDRPKGKLEAFWMHFAGHLLPETEDYQLAREVVHGEEAKTPAAQPIGEELAKRLETDMDAKGFTKVIRQGDTYFVDNNVSNAQLAGLKNQANAEGRKVITMDLHAGINPFDPELLTKVLDRFYGHGVQRSPVERLRHLEAKWSGYSAPAHATASETVANNLVRYAAADIYTSTIRALGPRLRGVYNRFYKEQALKEWVESGIKNGVYEYAPKGGGPGTIKGPVESIPVSIKGVGHKMLRVRADLAPEFKMALNGTGRFPKAGAQMLLDLATEAQIIGPTDFVFHTANMYSSIVKSAGKQPSYLADLASRLYGVKQTDALARIGYHLYKTLRDDPLIQAEDSRLAQIGAARGVEGEPSLLSKGVGKVLGETAGGIVDTGKWIRLLDRAGRRARSRMFDNLVKQGIYDDTELNRREFVNKMGQYNTKLMSYVQATAKNYTSQFVVAGRTFNRNAAQSILASNELRAASPGAYAKAKFSNLVSLFSTAIVVPIVANIVLNGKPFGRAGTPVGKIDTGKDSEDGRPMTIDPMKTDLSRRGARNYGIEAVVEGVKAGQDPTEILTRAVKDVILGQVHPWEGPPVRVGEAFLTKYGATGNAKESLIAAMKAINPTVTAFFTKDEKGERGGLGAVAKQAGEAFGVGQGRILSNLEKVEKQSGKPADQMSLRQRVLTERQVKEDRPPITKAEQAKSAVRAIENEQKRGDVIKSQLDKPTRAFLDSRQLDLPGYDNKLEYNKTKVYLTNNENKRLDALVKEEYLKTINMLKSSDRLKQFDSGTIQQRQQTFDHLMTEAARRAKLRLGKELYEKVPDESNAQTLGKTKRKRYSIFGQ